MVAIISTCRDLLGGHVHDEVLVPCPSCDSSSPASGSASSRSSRRRSREEFLEFACVDGVGFSGATSNCRWSVWVNMRIPSPQPICGVGGVRAIRCQGWRGCPRPCLPGVSAAGSSRPSAIIPTARTRCSQLSAVFSGRSWPNSTRRRRGSTSAVDRSDLADPQHCRDVGRADGRNPRWTRHPRQTTSRSSNPVDEFLELTPEQWYRTFDVNIHSFFHVTRAAVDHLTGGGMIIDTGSINGLRRGKQELRSTTRPRRGRDGTDVLPRAGTSRARHPGELRCARSCLDPADPRDNARGAGRRVRWAGSRTAAPHSRRDRPVVRLLRPLGRCPRTTAAGAGADRRRDPARLICARVREPRTQCVVA